MLIKDADDDVYGLTLRTQLPNTELLHYSEKQPISSGKDSRKEKQVQLKSGAH